MKSITTSTYWQSHNMLPILDNMVIDLAIEKNDLDLPLDSMFNMAARVNKKRGFLFVSNLLGKHIPVNPYVPLITSGLLAIAYYEQKTGIAIKQKGELVRKFLSQSPSELKEAYHSLLSLNLDVSCSLTIIGFAETATALGHGVYDCFDHATYIHTTRKQTNQRSTIIEFKEEHSHATNQACLGEQDLFDNENPILLVDDEITTGRTALNIIKELQKKFPRKEYTVLSILDWRSEEQRKAYQLIEKELDISINVVSLVSGQISFSGSPLTQSNALGEFDVSNKQPPVNKIDLSHLFIQTSYMSKQSFDFFIKETGRFGLLPADKEGIDAICEKVGTYLSELIKGEKTLCVGTGEFMYIPMKIASYMGENIYYQSTTRSPIHPVNKPTYGIKNGYRFQDPEDKTVVNYIYNVPRDKYDTVFIFTETESSAQLLQPLLSLFKSAGINVLYAVSFSSKKGSEFSGAKISSHGELSPL